ncbi:2OG-Fe(II) oxygenase [Ottowia sp.]|uniref:2OG-Fe(II) oxygenase n=1 Tax=Ottowia sp. TaxID=1898956 RepID=UPI003C74E6B8
MPRMEALAVNASDWEWAEIGRQLDAEGYAMLPGLLSAEVARSLARQVAGSGTARIPLAACDLGCGQLLYLGADLPEPLGHWRSVLYRHLAVIANRWNAISGNAGRYPAELGEFLLHNRQAGQARPQSYMSRLGAEDYMVLHQRNAGKQVFPMQIVVLLSEPDCDFQGGEFVMTEQRPRMQSRPSVLPLRLGDAAVIATAERPFKGAKGYYRVNMKHAVSRVRAGERIGLELSFHEAS